MWSAAAASPRNPAVTSSRSIANTSCSALLVEPPLDCPEAKGAITATHPRQKAAAIPIINLLFILSSFLIAKITAAYSLVHDKDRAGTLVVRQSREWEENTQ